MFPSSPMHSSLSCPPASEPSDVPCFQAHEWTPPSSSPPVGESSFAMCHVSELSTPLLPLPPLHLVLPLSALSLSPTPCSFLISTFQTSNLPHPPLPSLPSRNPPL